MIPSQFSQPVLILSGSMLSILSSRDRPMRQAGSRPVQFAIQRPRQALGFLFPGVSEFIREYCKKMNRYCIDGAFLGAPKARLMSDKEAKRPSRQSISTNKAKKIDARYSLGQ